MQRAHNAIWMGIWAWVSHNLGIPIRAHSARCLPSGRIFFSLSWSVSLMRMVAATMPIHTICTGNLMDRNDAISTPLSSIGTDKRAMCAVPCQWRHNSWWAFLAQMAELQGLDLWSLSVEEIGARDFVKGRRYTLGKLGGDNYYANFGELGRHAMHMKGRIAQAIQLFRDP